MTLQSFLLWYNECVDAILCYCMDTIYFLESSNGLIKIGYSTDIERRIRQISTMSPVPVNLIATKKGSPQHERALHSAFHRSHGEWFYADEKLRQYIKKYKKRKL